jgi:hypothetical protein
VHGGPGLDGRRAQRKKAAHAVVHELLAQGRSRRAIARHRLRAWLFSTARPPGTSADALMTAEALPLLWRAGIGPIDKQDR